MKNNNLQLVIGEFIIGIFLVLTTCFFRFTWLVMIFIVVHNGQHCACLLGLVLKMQALRAVLQQGVVENLELSC